jgi:predicted peptidase
MRKLAIWAFHGALDEVVPVERSARMIAALRQAGANPRYTELSDVGHDAWTSAFQNPELLPWLFSQRRGQDLST